MKFWHQLLLSMLGLSALLVSVLGITLLVYSQRLESDLLSRTVNEEVDFVLQQLARAAVPDLPETEALKIWIDAGQFVYAPTAFRDLENGEHHDIPYLGKRWHVLRRMTEFGLLTAAFDVSRIEAREQDMRWVVLVSALLVGGIGTLLALWLSRRLAEPVGMLAGSVDQMRGVRATTLARRFAGSELGTIAMAIDGLTARHADLLERERLITAAMSHELRTPLAVIQSSLDLSREATGPAQERALARADRASKGLADLLDSLLFIAREQSPHQLPSVGVKSVVDDAIHLLSGKLTGRHVHVVETTPCALAASPAHLRTVLLNLLRNAAQHTESGEIRVEIDEHGFAVADTGAGLPDVDPKQLLDAYVSHGDAVAGEPRFGIGLYIVSRICHHYGWAFSAGPNTPQGARFEVRCHG